MNKVYLGQVGLPSEAVSIILSVDWLLDRLPTFSASTISNHLDHFSLFLSFESTTLAWRMQALSLTTLTRFRIFLFSLLPGSARQSTFWEIPLELALSTTSARSYFFLVNLYDILSICFAQRGGQFGRISRVRKKLWGTVSSSKNSSKFCQTSQKGQPPKFPHFLSCLDHTSPLQEELLRLDKLEQEVPLELMVEKAEAKREEQSWGKTCLENISDSL